jgi:hypothetical protein
MEREIVTMLPYRTVKRRARPQLPWEKTKDGFVKCLELLDLLGRRRMAPQREEIRIAQEKRSKSNPLKS